MVSRIAALLVATSLAAIPTHCFGQEPDEFSDSALTREQWRQRLEEARQRSEEFVASARAQRAAPLQSDQKDAEASERAMNDPTLQRGDIIATDKGFFIFTGKDEERQPHDFRLAPNPALRR
ncbi:hypothetical protein [Bradyrhizobium australiense]|uniref:Uncharacterized protein n=1 Tax=Bradyrhizobium australiense TaxID=2721161 RepID=A0A7Y4GYJ0_9BRAD|nr:hypothetical protein [Bradyrhizobium australiense]NOJ43692.1 hypothetical protein [Bradyrhizobium australiense]